jgi:predicted dehydrogenase
MGKLHARVLNENIDAAELVGVVDANLATARAVARQRDCEAFSDVRQAVDLVDAAIIATPTVAHLDAARPFLEAGKHVLIEKPYCNDPEAGEELIRLAAAHNTWVQVGHTERFNPVSVAVQKYDIQPKFIEAHRISPYTFRSADVGVVLDMMIHDIDLVLMLAGGTVIDVQAVGVNVIGSTEDICNARLHFDNGCVANITASRLAVKTERKMRIFSPQAYVSVDYGQKVGIVIQKEKNLDLINMAREMDVDDIAELAANVDYTKLLNVEEIQPDETLDPLTRQAEAFRKTVEEGVPPVCSAADGLAAVRTAIDIAEKIKAHKWDGDAGNLAGPEIIQQD